MYVCIGKNMVYMIQYYLGLQASKGGLEMYAPADKGKLLSHLISSLKCTDEYVM